MSTPSFQNKTIRPERMINYSYYHSDRSRLETKVIASRKNHHIKRWLMFFVLIAICGGFFVYNSHANGSNLNAVNLATSKSIKLKTNTPTPLQTKPAAPAVAAKANPCADNTLNQLVLVSITDQHLWACQNTTALFDSPVVTGIAAHPDTVTPTGTYHIYSMVTNTVLRGCDSTGCWNDPVHYWMPFLDNQYGAYGLHDATWRTANEFGNISPSSSDGSQGCVELPLATAQWLFKWVSIGTTVTINS
jgi:lipoprotein-anchoring transpeptidase ErfK/SrfK